MPTKNKIVLIHMYSEKSEYGSKSENVPVGIGYLSEILTRIGILHEVIDMGLGYEYKDVKELIQNNDPKLIGISMMSLSYENTYSFIGAIKRDFPKVKIVAGGPHVTAFKGTVLEECKGIDFGVVGEGEYTLLEILNGTPSNEIPGLIHRQNGEVVFNGVRDYIFNLDELPFPRYEKFNLDDYKPLIPVLSSRGCPFQCIFCQQSCVLGKKWRARSPEHLLGEIKYWHSRNIKRIHFLDDNFALNKDRIIKFCNLLQENNILDMEFSCAGIHTNTIDEEVLTAMKGAGFRYLAFGVESGSDRILTVLKKGTTVKQVEKALSISSKLGFDVKLYFIVGSPYETLDDVKASVKLALKYPITLARFTNMVPYDGSELMDWVKKEGRLLYSTRDYLNDQDRFTEQPIFDGPGMSLAEKKEAFKIVKKAMKKIDERRGIRSAKNILKRKFKLFYPFLLPLYYLYHYLGLRKVMKGKLPQYLEKQQDC